MLSGISRQAVTDKNLADHHRPRPKSTNLYLISDRKLDLESASSGHRHGTMVVPPPVGMDWEVHCATVCVYSKVSLFWHKGCDGRCVQE
jgi:hypothetical protein